MSWAVEVRDLVKAFGTFVAVDGVSFQVGKGEIFGFLGPNGAGKSTVIRMLCGLLRPTSGQAWVNGHDCARDAEIIRRHLGYMSQKFSLYDDLTVEENLEFFSGVYGVPRARRVARQQEILEMAGLAGQRATLTRLLPGGWKQRLALGCAIAHEPAIVILDEPTSGVDPIARRQFWDLIYGLSAAGHTILLSTHYMDEAEYCHRLALMHGGRLIALGAPRELKQQLRSRPLLRLDTPEPLESMRALEGQPGLHDVAVFGGGLHVTVDDVEPAAALIRRLHQERGIAVQRLEPVRPSMEDVFVSLIRAGGGTTA